MSWIKVRTCLGVRKGDTRQGCVDNDEVEKRQMENVKRKGKVVEKSGKQPPRTGHRVAFVSGYSFLISSATFSGPKSVHIRVC